MIEFIVGSQVILSLPRLQHYYHEPVLLLTYVGTFLRFAGIPPTAAHVGSCGALLARCWVRLGTVFVTGIVLEYLQTVERLGDLRQNRIVPAIELPQRGGIRQVELRQPVRRAVQLGEHFARGEVECLKFVPSACEDLQGRTALQVDPL